MTEFEIVKGRLNKRENEAKITLEEAQIIFDDTSIHIGFSIMSKKYFWFGIMSECRGFDTVTDAVSDALEYMENGGY